MLEMPRPCLRRHPEHPDMRCVDIAGHGGAHMAHDAVGRDVLWHDDDDGLAGLAAREALRTPTPVTDELERLRAEVSLLQHEARIRQAINDGLAAEVERLRYALDAECTKSLALQARVTMLDRADRLNTLQAGYEEGVDEERAAVVAWLRDMGQDCRLMGRIREGEAVAYYANLIERGEHRREEEP